MKDILISFRLASVLFLLRVQVAEENGMEVLDQLAANPVSTSQPLGVDTLSSQQEDRLSTRYVSVRREGGGGMFRQTYKYFCLSFPSYRLAALRQPN